MAAPEFASLRALMGDDWIEANVLSEKAEHVLGRWYRKANGNPWVQYTDQLVERLLKGDRLVFDKADLARKLAAEYVPTLAEIEVAVHLLEHGCGLVLEPMAQRRGRTCVRTSLTNRISLKFARSVIPRTMSGLMQSVPRFSRVSTRLHRGIRESNRGR